MIDFANDVCRALANGARDRDAAAYRTGDDVRSYGALWADAQRTAGLLRRQGTGPVLIRGTAHPDTLTAMLACLLAGRAYVPIDPQLPGARAAAIRAQTRSTCTLRSADCAGDGLRLAELDAFRDAPVQAQPGDTAYIIFTSGSTGTPKGVPISVRNLAHFIRWLRTIPALHSDTPTAVFNPARYSFDLSVAGMYLALSGGHTLVAPSAAQAARLTGAREAMAAAGASVAVVTPTYFKRCLLDEACAASAIPTLRCIYFCGERLDPSLVRAIWARFPAVRIVNAYGPTEATSAVSAIEITPQLLAAEPVLPVGTSADAAVQITADDGELVLRGASVFGGYLDGCAGGYFRDGGENAYRTGDLGAVRGGRIYCFGRCDQQVKYKGYRIELGDIEENINRIPGVRECAVIPRRYADGAVKLLKAFVAADGMDAGQIRAALAAALPEYMIPKVICCVDALPVNANGKIDRKELASR